MKIEIDLPEIEGYEYTGEFRGPRGGEYFKNLKGVDHTNCDVMAEYPILKKKAPDYETIGFDSDGRVILANGSKQFVEIKALTDALSLVNFGGLAAGGKDSKLYITLRALIK